MKSLHAILNEIKEAGDSALLNKHCYYGLSELQLKSFAAADIPTYKGKVREVLRRGSELFIVHTDRLTAFDRMIAMIPYKGLMLAEISEFWLKEAGKLVPTHFIDRPDPRVIRGKRTTPYKIEVVVRGYLAGSMMRAYEAGEREFCGELLAEGINSYGKLPENIITPTTKAAAFEHDENASSESLIASGVVTADEWAEIVKLAQTLFKHGQEVFARYGWILVDTKYEFGKTDQGDIILIDEIHTPDSSRLWDMSSYEVRMQEGRAPMMLDKENVRRYLLEQGFSGYGDVPQVPVSQLIGLADVYLNVCETLIGKELKVVGDASQPDLSSFLRLDH